MVWFKKIPYHLKNYIYILHVLLLHELVMVKMSLQMIAAAREAETLETYGGFTIF
jgi:hypothetical protein